MSRHWLWPLLFVVCAVLAAGTGWIAASRYQATARHQNDALARQSRRLTHQVILQCNANSVLNDFLTGALHRQRRVLLLDQKAGKAASVRIDKNGVTQLVRLIDAYTPSVAFCEARK